MPGGAISSRQWCRETPACSGSDGRRMVQSSPRPTTHQAGSSKTNSLPLRLPCVTLRVIRAVFIGCPPPKRGRRVKARLSEEAEAGTTTAIESEQIDGENAKDVPERR